MQYRPLSNLATHAREEESIDSRTFLRSVMAVGEWKLRFADELGEGSRVLLPEEFAGVDIEKIRAKRTTSSRSTSITL